MTEIKSARCRPLFLGKKVQIGKDFSFGGGTIFWSPNQNSIGDNVYIGKHLFIQTDEKMGNDAFIANNVGLIDRYDCDSSVVSKKTKHLPTQEILTAVLQG